MQLNKNQIREDHTRCRLVSMHIMPTWERVAAFPTVLDFGGRRLCLVPADPWILVAAAYHVHGVCAYDGSGRVLWRRTDLKKAQQVRAFRGDDGSWLVTVGREGGPLAVLDARTGRTAFLARGVGEVFGGAGAFLHVLRSRAVKLVSPDSTRTWSVDLDSFAVLDAAFSTEDVAFSEAAGAVRCFTLSGGHSRWTWNPAGGAHVNRVVWQPESACWQAIRWPYQHGGSVQLVQLDLEGRVVRERELEPAVEREFLGRGEFMVSSGGTVRRLADDDLVWRFGS
jgi:hypothetical protein